MCEEGDRVGYWLLLLMLVDMFSSGGWRLEEGDWVGSWWR